MVILLPLDMLEFMYAFKDGTGAPLKKLLDFEEALELILDIELVYEMPM